MKEFSQAKNGFNKDEVMDFVKETENLLDEKNQQIAYLEKELLKYKEKEQDIKQKSESISIALTAAVEKAKQIEKSSLNVYNLKIQELEILYSRWEKVLNELIEKYPKLDEVDHVKRLMEDFRSAIKSNLKEDFRFVGSTNVVTKSTDPMRALLSKMNTYLDRQVSENKDPKIKPRIRKQLPKDMIHKQSELNKLEEKSAVIKPIYNAQIDGDDKYESLLDKFLSEDATPDSAYASMITSKTGTMPKANETGFDLKEAVNPKDDLEEIMKSFDFFN